MAIVLVVMAIAPSTLRAGDSVEVAVYDAWIREAPPMSQVLAGYAVLQNQGTQAYTLTGASSPDFERVMLHKTEMKDGMARMTHQPELRIAAGGSAVLEPGGLHLMLMRPKRALRAGDRVMLELFFGGSQRLSVDFEVRQ